MRVLVVNAGSSSLKLSLIGDRDERLANRELPSAPGTGELADALAGQLGTADAVGHRIVHGGERFTAPVRVDRAVAAALYELADLAPLHQPRSLAALEAVSAELTGRPVVACFDTAFHTTLPATASTYALPARLRERWRLRRYGFHGLSHAWIARRAPELLRLPAAGLRIVSCHLGAGASLCAIAGGRSIETTMGFTPLEGLVMATRSGSVDPGLLLWLLEHDAMSAAQLGDALEHESGLLGLAGTADMRELLARVGAGEPQAELALGVYVHRLRAGVAAMAAALGGLDALIFTGGVGERSARIRELTAGGLGFLGVRLDHQANRQATGDTEIGLPDATVRAALIEAREDLEVAAQVRGVLTPGA